MNELVARSANVSRGGSWPELSRTEHKQLQAANNREIASGIVRGTQLSVANFLTITAMQHTAGLVQLAYAAANGDEYLASRLGALVDGYVTYARSRISDQ